MGMIQLDPKIKSSIPPNRNSFVLHSWGLSDDKIDFIAEKVKFSYQNSNFMDP